MDIEVYMLYIIPLDIAFNHLHHRFICFKVMILKDWVPCGQKSLKNSSIHT